MKLLKNEKTQQSTVTLVVEVPSEKFTTLDKSHEDFNKCYEEVLEFAIKEANIQPVAEPKFDVEAKNDNQEVICTIVFPVYPEMTLKAYKGLEVDDVKPTEIDDATIEEAVAHIAKEFTRIEPVNREAQTMDTVNFDFEGFVDGVAFEGGKAEGYDLVLGSGQFIPGFEDQLIGSKAGQDLDVIVTFPAEYMAEELASKEAVFKCHINEVKTTITPEFNDELVQAETEFNSLAEFKVAVAEKLKYDYEMEADNKFQNAVLEKLVANLEGEVPHAMYERQVHLIIDDLARRLTSQGLSIDMYLQMNGIDMQELGKSVSPQAEHQIKTQLALGVVARYEKLSVSEAELDQEIQNLAQQYNITVEQVTQSVSRETLKSDFLIKTSAEFVFSQAVKK